MYMNRHFIIPLPILSLFPVLHSDVDTWGGESSVSMNQGSRKKSGNISRSIFTETSNVLQISKVPIDGIPHARSVQDFRDYEVDI